MATKIGPLARAMNLRKLIVSKAFRHQDVGSELSQESQGTWNKPHLTSMK